MIRAAAATALTALLLLIPSAPAAKAPPLAATAQYKAFVDYVKKLDGLVGQPTTAAQKAKYESELTAKRTAAAHKANALSKRASEEAKAEFDAKSKEQAEIVRQIEDDELEAAAAEFDGKIDRATGSYQLKLTRVDQGRQTFEARLRERIEALRTQKAQTPDVAQKTAIQERIAALIEQIAAKRAESAQKRTDLKAAFSEQKQQIEAARVARADEIAAAAAAKIAKIAKHWKKAADDKKASLDAKREQQLAYIEAKLEKGRTDIASMPVTG
ncbi:MAG TPA: hypothetical protein VFX85_02310 [Solirubrobacterales bacterium]|nr:hypothetical protein [Solirubrobacterales bacterium]